MLSEAAPVAPVLTVICVGQLRDVQPDVFGEKQKRSHSNTMFNGVFFHMSEPNSKCIITIVVLLKNARSGQHTTQVS